MGCNMVKAKVGQRPSTIDCVVKSSPKLTAKDKMIIKQTWQNLKEHVANVGFITFISLFESHPEVRDVFSPFRSKAIDELQHSVLLRQHSLKVMGVVDKCVYRIDEPAKFKEVMAQLGCRHFTYNVNPEFFNYMGTQFIQAIKPHLDDVWSTDVENAWLSLFRVLTFEMRSGYEVEHSKSNISLK